MVLGSRCWLGAIVCLWASCAIAQEKLIFALDLIRHGDRTAIHSIPNSPPFEWELAPGELTAEGMRQEYELGAQHRQAYIEQYRLLPSHYDSESMYVRSTDVNRTLMSAQSFLMGLYPLGTGPAFALPKAFQPIPIHTVSRSNDDLVPDPDHQELKQLFQRYVFTTPEWKKETARWQTHFPAWSAATGEKITSLEQLRSIADALFISELHHAPLPPKLSRQDVQEIIQTGKWVLAAIFKPKPVGDAIGGPVVKLIVNYLQQGIAPGAKCHYVLLSAHDTTLLAVMSALGVPLSMPPHYASDLNFAVYETAPQHYLIKVTYNGEPVTIPACGGATCTVDALSSLNRHAM